MRYGQIGLFMLTAALAACGGDAGGDAAGDGLTGRITIDGSSTVFPISQAMAEEFMAAEGREVRVTVSQSGTGGGFKRFCVGETEISDASRPIKAEERELCAQNGVEPIELEVAKDGITVVVHPDNTFVDCLTTAELKAIWEPGSTIQRWSQVRSGWPDEQIKLYGPGTDSGTFDYFTEAIMGEEDMSRPDYTASEDDNVLVQGVAGDRGSLGYFGYAYFEENRQRVRGIPVNAGSGCVEATDETIASGEYAPLSRPIFIYVNAAAARRPEVAGFLRFYNEHGDELVSEVGYIPLDANQYEANIQQIDGLAGPT